MPKDAKIAIPVALLSVIAVLLIWLSNRAFSNEHRLTTVEAESRSTKCNLLDLRADIREIKMDIKTILSERKEARDGQ